MKPAYLIAGTDAAKVDAALARLRDRAVREGGEGALESFSPPDGQGPPDAEALIAAIPAMSLMVARRYLLADNVERWSPKQVERGRRRPSPGCPGDDRRAGRARGPAEGEGAEELAEAVEKAGGEVLTYGAPSARELPGWLAAEAPARGFAIDPDAARLLVDRIGDRNRPAVATSSTGWRCGRATAAASAPRTSRAMMADTSEATAGRSPTRSSSGERPLRSRIAERLAAQGESRHPDRLRGRERGCARRTSAASELEAGRSAAARSRRASAMSPYRGEDARPQRRAATSPGELRAAIGAVADLEWWTRGGSEYADDDGADARRAPRRRSGARRLSEA